jgi:mannan endo-1,4-beta-mannosidase
MKFKSISALFTIAVFAASCAVEKPKSSYTVHPADSLATTGTANLYQNMADVTKRGIMFGQQDAVLYGLGWRENANRSDVKSVCGDYPAVYGWEIGRIEHGAEYSIDSVNFDLMRKRIIEAYKRGGINTISWHADNPVTNGNAWDVSQKGVVASVLPGGAKHELFMTWLDKVAGFLNSLESGGNKIPILFRPFHEHTGSWFWWGENLCTPDEYKAMVRMTVDYFRQKGLHNLLYIYSPDQTDQPARYFERYPGDNYMDMLGVDYYQQQGTAGAPQYMQTMNNILAMLSTEAKNRNKLFVFSETGLEGLPMNNWWTDVLLKTIKPYPVTYVMVWRNAYDKPGHFFGPYPGHPSAKNFMEFFKDGKTLFQGDISNMYK